MFEERDEEKRRRNEGKCNLSKKGLKRENCLASLGGGDRTLSSTMGMKKKKTKKKKTVLINAAKKKGNENPPVGSEKKFSECHTGKEKGGSIGQTSDLHEGEKKNQHLKGERGKRIHAI